MTMTMTANKAVRERYWHLLQLIDEKRQEAGSDYFAISYHDIMAVPELCPEPIAGTFTFTSVSRLFERVERGGGIKVVEYPQVGYLSANPAGNFFEVRVLPLFDNLISQERRYHKRFSRVDKTVPDVHYNPVTGIGYINGTRFRFKDDQPDFRVFAELYANINETVKRERVLELAGFKQEAEEVPLELKNNPKRKPASKTSETYFIKELVGKMRERTKLSADQLSNNNGNFTLVGNKLAEPPK